MRHIGKRSLERGQVAPLLMGLLLLVVLLAAVPALAQDAPITDDEVNAIAKRLYCPVCENIPLDTCGTSACIQWREEIRTQLAQGSTPEQVVVDFVQRFGERVVGTPQDPMLRALSLVTPWILAAIALVVAGVTLNRWRKRGATAPPAAAAAAPPVTGDGSYRSRLESDLMARR